MTSHLVLSTHLSLRGDADPQLPARVLALLTVRGQLPQRFAFAVEDDQLHIDVRLPRLAADDARQLSDRLQRVPSVRSVETMTCGQRLRGALTDLNPAAQAA